MRLINADVLKQHIDKLPALPDGNFAGNHSALKALKNMQPTVDAVPVVRCKDCIRFFPVDDVWGWCTVSGKMRCKDYCSYGVREDGDHNDTV